MGCGFVSCLHSAPAVLRTCSSAAAGQIALVLVLKTMCQHDFDLPIDHCGFHLLQGGSVRSCQQWQSGRLGEQPRRGGRSVLCLFCPHSGSFQHDFHLVNHRCGFRWLQGGLPQRCRQLQAGRPGERPPRGGRLVLHLFAVHPGKYQCPFHLANHRRGFRWLQSGLWDAVSSCSPADQAAAGMLIACEPAMVEFKQCMLR
jgi:hypothetical protein